MDSFAHGRGPSGEGDRIGQTGEGIHKDLMENTIKNKNNRNF